MANESKGKTAPEALRRHLEQQGSSAHAGPSRRQDHAHGSFRGNHQAGQSESDYTRQLAELNLNLSHNEAFGGQHQSPFGTAAFRPAPNIRAEEFLTSQAGRPHGGITTPHNFDRVGQDSLGNNGTALNPLLGNTNQRYVAPMFRGQPQGVAQAPAFQGGMHAPVLPVGMHAPAFHGGFQAPAFQGGFQAPTMTAAEIAAKHEESRVAYEAEFEEAQDAWMMEQFRLEAEADVKKDAEIKAAARAQAQAQAAAQQTAAAQAEPSQAASELSRVAQQLVDAVENNKSEKFRQSSFLDLMRRVAAREVVVENNSLVEVTTAATDNNKEDNATSAKDVKGKGKAVGRPASVEDA